MFAVQEELLERSSTRNTLAAGNTIAGLGRTVSVGDFLRQFHRNSVQGLHESMDGSMGGFGDENDGDESLDMSFETISTVPSSGSSSNSSSEDEDENAKKKKKKRKKKQNEAGQKISRVLKEYVKAKEQQEKKSKKGPQTEVEKLFGLFSRLHDDEAFDDWLSLGIPTTVDPDPEILHSDVTQGVRATNQMMKDAIAKNTENLDVFDPSFVMSITRDLSKVQSYDELKRQRMTGSASPTSPVGSAKDEKEGSVNSFSTSFRSGPRETPSPRGPRINRFSVVHQTRSITDKRDEVERYIDKFVKKLDDTAQPKTFSEFVRRCDELLEELSNGASLHNWAVVEEAEQVLLTAQEMSATSFGCDMLLTYVIRFLNSQVARSEEDYLIREDIVSRALIVQADVRLFVETILQIERKINEIKDFDAARDSTAEAINALLVPLESLLSDIQRDVAFPFQRRAIMRHQASIDDYVYSTIQFLQEFDVSVTLLIPSHQQWKQKLLDEGYRRLHAASDIWMNLSLGYVEPLLQKTQRVEDRRSAVSGMKREVKTYEIIEWMVKDDKVPLAQVAFHFKNVKSDVVGLQLVMAARHLVGELDSKFDDAWGFGMP